MSYSLGQTLFQSEAREAVLSALFLKGLSASASELARRSGLSTKAVANEVRHLRATGLVHVESVGAGDLVRANREHPAAAALVTLLETPATAPRSQRQHTRVRESLAFWGAPLAGARPVQRFRLEETVLLGLEEAARDATVLRTLPTLLARNWSTLDWADLREGARRRKLKPHLGMLAELTATLLGSPTSPAEQLRDRRLKAMRFFPDVKNKFEAELARQRSPEVARRWGFWMNLSEESFRSTLEQHRA